MAFIALGNAITVAATTAATVSNVATNVNTFRFLNANSSAVSYVGVFNSYAQAQAMTTTTGTVLAPNWPDIIQGNWGLNPAPGVVYIATIASGNTQTVVAQPVRSIE